ncbi:MAG: hypothetical protein U1F70_05075 [Candidatus Competibacteraceae bacterium]
MFPNQIPIKTTKGLQEVGSRTYGLSPTMRRILIMVNGHSTVAELIKKLVGFGDIQTILAQLEIDGFIAPNPALNPPPETSQRLIPETSRRPVETARQPIETSQRPTTAAPPPHGPQPEFNMEKAKGFIRFILLGAMGPSAERRINRIEATTTPEELRVELDAIHDMLPKVLSKKDAQQAWHQLEPIMASLHAPLP